MDRVNPTGPPPWDPPAPLPHEAPLTDSQKTDPPQVIAGEGELAPPLPSASPAVDPSSIGARLRAVEGQYQKLMSLTDDAIWCITLDAPVAPEASPSALAAAIMETGRFSEANGGFKARLYVPEAEEVVGRRPKEFPGFWLLEDRGRLERLAGRGFNVRDETTVEIDRLGRIRHLRFSLVGMSEHGSIVSVMGLERDISDEIEENDVLRESAELYQAVSRSALDGIFVLDEQLMVVDCNEAYSELVGMPRDEIVTRGDCRVFPEAEDGLQAFGYKEIRAAGSWRGEARLDRMNGETALVELSCRYSDVGRGSFYCFVRDLSARRLAERREREHHEALAHVSRLSTLGEMASGIAHEFNQPLAAIVNYANGCVRLLEQRGVDDQMVFRALRSIVDQGKRASEIIRRLRSFSRRSEDNREAFVLSDLLTDAVALTNQSRARSGITLETRFEADEDSVVVDGIQIEQVVMNLLLNAVDALAKGQEGVESKVLVSTRIVSGPQGEPFVPPQSGDDPAAHHLFVETSVQDNGPGLEAESARHLFEPFYSATGQGLGLGLTIGRSIVEAHGGRLWLDASPPAVWTAEEQRHGPGACFRFTLPLRRGPMPR